MRTGRGRFAVPNADRDRRDRVANGCFCTHESNCYYPSLPFNPGHLVEIKKIENQMKEAAECMKT